MSGNFEQSLVEEKPEYIESMQFLELQGVFKGFTSRAGAPMAKFEHDYTVVIGTASVTDKAVTEKDRNALLGHLLVKAADLGWSPVELVALGLAAALKRQKPSRD